LSTTTALAGGVLSLKIDSSDTVKGVRTRAAYGLAGEDTARLTAGERERFERAAQEFVAAIQFNGDRPELRSMLGAFYLRRGATAEAKGVESRAAN
jgi:Flp pilus assembly protein TadD